MFTILLVLFLIALVLIVAGFFLSPRSKAPAVRKMSYDTRSTGAVRVYRSGSRVYRSQDVRLKERASRYSAYRYRAENVEGGLPRAQIAFNGFNVRQLLKPDIERPSSWLGLGLILITVCGFGLFTLRPLFFHQPVIAIFDAVPSNIATTTPTANRTSAQSASQNQSLPIGTSGASKALVRLNQMDPAQYASTQEFNQWAASACSAAAMTEVVNAYSPTKFRVTNILKVESNLGQITPEEGLLQSAGLGITLSKFGLKTTYMSHPTLDDVIKVANQGHPVIVDFPPSNWPGGHLLVVRGGNATSVDLADSSVLNMQVMARSTFLKYWGGLGAVAYPAKS